jgi:hypothetical protein
VLERLCFGRRNVIRGGVSGFTSPACRPPRTLLLETESYFVLVIRKALMKSFDRKQGYVIHIPASRYLIVVLLERVLKVTTGFRWPYGREMMASFIPLEGKASNALEWNDVS